MKHAQGFRFLKRVLLVLSVSWAIVATYLLWPSSPNIRELVVWASVVTVVPVLIIWSAEQALEHFVERHVH